MQRVAIAMATGRKTPRCHLLHQSRHNAATSSSAAAAAISIATEKPKPSPDSCRLGQKHPCNSNSNSNSNGDGDSECECGDISVSPSPSSVAGDACQKLGQKHPCNSKSESDNISVSPSPSSMAGEACQKLGQKHPCNSNSNSNSNTKSKSKSKSKSENKSESDSISVSPSPSMAGDACQKLLLLQENAESHLLKKTFRKELKEGLQKSQQDEKCLALHEQKNINREPLLRSIQEMAPELADRPLPPVPLKHLGDMEKRIEMMQKDLEDARARAISAEDELEKRDGEIKKMKKRLTLIDNLEGKYAAYLSHLQEPNNNSWNEKQQNICPMIENLAPLANFLENAMKREDVFENLGNSKSANLKHRVETTASKPNQKPDHSKPHTENQYARCIVKDSKKKKAIQNFSTVKNGYAEMDGKTETVDRTYSGTPSAEKSSENFEAWKCLWEPELQRNNLVHDTGSGKESEVVHNLEWRNGSEAICGGHLAVVFSVWRSFTSMGRVARTLRTKTKALARLVASLLGWFHKVGERHQLERIFLHWLLLIVRTSWGKKKRNGESCLYDTFSHSCFWRHQRGATPKRRDADPSSGLEILSPAYLRGPHASHKVRYMVKKTTNDGFRSGAIEPQGLTAASNRPITGSSNNDHRHGITIKDLHALEDEFRQVQEWLLQGTMNINQERRGKADGQSDANGKKSTLALIKVLQNLATILAETQRKCAADLANNSNEKKMMKVEKSSSKLGNPQKSKQYSYLAASKSNSPEAPFHQVTSKAVTHF